MPGTPPNSPNFDIPRYSDSDNASFSAQVNAITDGFDANAANLNGTGTQTFQGAVDFSGAASVGGTLSALGALVLSQGLQKRWSYVGTTTSHAASDGEFVDCTHTSGVLIVTLPVLVTGAVIAVRTNFAFGVAIEPAGTSAILQAGGHVFGSGQTLTNLPLLEAGAYVVLLGADAGWVVIGGSVGTGTGYDCGTVSVTGAGAVAVSHSLGVAPRHVGVTPSNTAGGDPTQPIAVTNKTASTFTVQPIAGSGSYTVDWIAFA